MKPRISTRRQSAGFALLIVTGFAAASLLLLSATMRRSSAVAKMNERNNQYTATLAAAEAATEKIIARILSDYRSGGENLVYNSLGSYQNTVPLGSEASYWTNYAFSNPQNGANGTYIGRTVVATTNLVALGFEYEGLKGYASTYRIISNARRVGTRYNITNAVQQDVQTASLPLFQFAIFYNSLLEFSTAATMEVRGPVHANADIYVGSASALTFYNAITCTGSIIKKNPWAGSSSMSGAITYNVSPKTNVTSLILPIGTNNTADAVRQVIYPPPAGEAITSEMGQQRYFNKAQLNLVVSNSTVTAWVKQNIDDLSSNTIPWTNFNNTFISTNVTFTDQREASKTVKTTQIDVGKLRVWLSTNSTVLSKLGSSPNPTNLPLTLYVADFRTNSSTTMTAIRLTNGTVLPAGGLTVATPNPLYVMGNYNTPSSANVASTNTSGTAPASLLSDALTILSTAWVSGNYDTKSTQDFGNRPAATTTVNAAMLTGVVYSTGSAKNQFSGGVHNLPRLLENWDGDTLWLNTSIVNLFNSVIATNQFIYPGESGDYYTPPSRKFSFDVNFNDPAKQPPATPQVRVLIRTKWVVPPPSTTNYAGIM
jgi:hypothetical protein